MKIIAVDVDDTVADFSGYILSSYNYHCDNYDNDSLTIGNRTLFVDKQKLLKSDLVSDLETVMGKEIFEYTFYTYMKSVRAITKLGVIPGAVEFINRLREDYRVIFATAPSFKYDNWCDERRAWLYDNFNCDDKDMCFVHDKNLINADILVDDRPKYLNAWAKGTGKPCIKFQQPWNVEAAGILAKNYNEVLGIIKTLTR